MTSWAKLHKDWLAQFLDLTNGLPSHDLLSNLFRRINPKEFERCLLSWLAALHDASLGKLIAIDGRTLRGSFDTATARSALHMASAWAVSQKLSLGSVTVDRKSNEITAIPELLKLLELAGATVTIDAMGCQAKIASAILAGDGDYILAVKRDKPTLYEGIEAFFLEHMSDDFARVKVSRHEAREAGHGRTEHGTYYVCDIPANWPEAKRWKGLKRIGMAISDTVRDGKECDAMRYYILSQGSTARRSGTLVRGHCGIENSLHWQLDVSFGEDKDRTRRDHASANLGVLRRTALSLLKRERTAKGRRQKQAAHSGVEHGLFKQTGVQ